jgi:hypothetical protein
MSRLLSKQIILITDYGKEMVDWQGKNISEYPLKNTHEI